MKTPIVIKKLSLADLCAFESYLRRVGYESPVRETERQIEKRFAKQDRLRGILKRVQLELRHRTREVV